MFRVVFKSKSDDTTNMNEEPRFGKGLFKGRIGINGDFIEDVDFLIGYRWVLVRVIGLMRDFIASLKKKIAPDYNRAIFLFWALYVVNK